MYSSGLFFIFFRYKNDARYVVSFLINFVAVFSYFLDKSIFSFAGSSLETKYGLNEAFLIFL